MLDIWGLSLYKVWSQNISNCLASTLVFQKFDFLKIFIIRMKNLYENYVALTLSLNATSLKL